MTDRRFDRRRRLNRMTAVNPRVPRPPGRTLDPERRLRGLVDIEEDDAIDRRSSSPMGKLGRRLGPKGRFLVVSIVIGTAITMGSIFWEQWSNETATAANPANPAQVALGHSLYDQHCAFCHAADLQGRTGWDGDHPNGNRPPLPLDGAGAIWRLGDRDLFDVIKFGGQPFSPPTYKNDMPGFEGRLSDADLWAILAFVKSRWPAEIHEKQEQAAAERAK
ncbi:cytochrome c, class I [alpha proteobacterium BAL199]|jgi:mono/diheme cytochrome c family protein|nr:cytochrome c, class I [alpha proteobacterium BAL199]